MSSTSNVIYVETPVVRFRGKMWNVMMSCAYLKDGKLGSMDHKIEDDTHYMSTLDKYIPATPEYAEAIDAFLSANETHFEPDLSIFYKQHEVYHLKLFKPRISTKGNRKTTVAMLDGTAIDGGPGGRNQDVLILGVGSSEYTTRRVKFVPAFVWRQEVEELDDRMRRAIVAGVHV